MDDIEFKHNKEQLERLAKIVIEEKEFTDKETVCLVNFNFEENLSTTESLDKIIGPEYRFDTLKENPIPISVFFEKFKPLLRKYKINYYY